MAIPLAAFDGYADAMEDNYDRRVSANIRTCGVAVPIHISTSGDPQGSYRCDEAIEEANGASLCRAVRYDWNRC